MSRQVLTFSYFRTPSSHPDTLTFTLTFSHCHALTHSHTHIHTLSYPHIQTSSRSRILTISHSHTHALTLSHSHISQFRTLTFFFRYTNVTLNFTRKDPTRMSQGSRKNPTKMLQGSGKDPAGILLRTRWFFTCFLADLMFFSAFALRLAGRFRNWKIGL